MRSISILQALLAALLLPIAAAASLNGFPTFAWSHEALTAIAAGLLMLSLSAGSTDRATSRSSALLIAFTGFVTLWVGFSERGAESLDAIAYWVAALALSLWASRAASDKLIEALRLSIFAAAALVGLSLIGQLFGLSFPSAIPFHTSPGAGLRATFDQQAEAAVFGVVIALSATALAIADLGRFRSFSVAAAAIGALTVGIAGGWPEGVSLATGSAVGLLPMLRGDSSAAQKRIAAGLLAAAMGFGVVAGATALTPSPSLNPDREPAVIYMHSLAPVMIKGGEAEQLDFYQEAGRSLAVSSLPFGAGPAGVARDLPLHHRSSHAWRINNSAEAQIVSRLPTSFWDLLAHWGLGVSLLLIALFIGPVSSLRHAASSAASRSLLLLFTAATAVWLFMPGGNSLAALLLVIITARVASGIEPSGDAQESGESTHERKPSAAGGRASQIAWRATIAAAGLLSLVTGAQAARSGLEVARTSVFLGHGMAEEALEASDRAVGIQLRFIAEHNAAIAKLYGPSDEFDPRPAQAHLERAIALRPNQPGVLIEMAKLALSLAPSTAEETEGHLGVIANMMQRTLQIQPNNYRAAEILADVNVLRFEPQDAADTLQQLLSNDLSPQHRGRILLRLAQIHDDFLDDPEQALSYYRRALEEPLPHTQETLARDKANEMEIWIRTGQRPEYRPGGHDHLHDHDDLLAPQQPDEELQQELEVEQGAGEQPAAE